MEIDPPDDSAISFPAGVTEDQIRGAIDRSGYPLQYFVGELLRELSTGMGNIFRIQDEWTFIDRESGESRNLDLRGDASLSDIGVGQRVRPQLTLLIECKQSELPYVFFGRRERPFLPHYPILAGLRHEDITVTTDDSRDRWTLALPNVLILEDANFFSTPLSCRTFSKCARKGKELELSGTEPYNAIVQPLTKAIRHLRHSEAPADTHQYFDAHLTVALAVLDAPMYAVTLENGAQKLERTTWLRVLRHEHDPSKPAYQRDRTYGIEVVQRQFLEEFLKEYLLPFADDFGGAVMDHQAELVSGKGFISGLLSDSTSSLRARLKKR
jgi:hypothetical protein